MCGCWRQASLFLCLAVAGLAEQLPIQTYSADNGLADNHINRIRQDSRGFLWFATDGGLSRFDGYTFTNYTTAQGLPHHWVNDLIEARNGDYWVATDGGVCRFNGSTSSQSRSAFACYDPSTNHDARRVNALLEERSGVIWCATYDGIYRLETFQGHPVFRHVNIGAPSVYEGSLVNNLLLDREGNLWAASRTGLYRRVTDDHWERYTTAHGLPHGWVETLLEDSTGRLWAGTRNGGFCLLVVDRDPARPIVERCYSTRDGLGADDVRSLFRTSDGRLWIGTAGGLSQLQPSGRIVTYTTSHGLSDAVVYKLAEDREGNLWIGTKHAGVMKLDRRGFISYGQADGFRPGDDSFSIFQTRYGQVCITSGGAGRRYVQCLEGNHFSAIPVPLPSSLLVKGQGWRQPVLPGGDAGWWVATAEGLFRFAPVQRVEDLASAKPYQVRISGFNSAYSNVGRIYEDPEGDMWIPVSYHYVAELIRWNRSTGEFIRVSEITGFKGKLANAFTRDRAGRLWIGFEGGGIVRCGTNPTMECQTVRGVPRGDIYALHMDNAGRLWAASSEGGLARCDDPSELSPRFISYTSESGLSSNEVWCIAEDHRGRIYAGTSRGLDRLDPSTGLIRHFTVADGLAPGRIQAAYCDRHGTMWFASHRVVSRLDPIPGSAPPPLIRITGVRVSGVARSLSDLGETRTGPLHLASSENSLEVSFVGLSFSAGGHVRYQYVVEGLGGSWSPPTDARSALFPRLSSGSYRFSVRAVGPDGVTSSEPASLAFSIAQPFWQRWWFVCMSLATCAAGVWTWHRHRLVRALEMERVRSRIATDLHDEIGSSLSRIAIIAEVVHRQLDSIAPPDSRRLLAGISASARGLIEGLGDIVWSVDPNRDNLSSLVARVREFTSDILDARGIRWQFETPPMLDHVALSPDHRRDLYLIFKEAVTNVARHSCSATACLSLEIAENQLTASVSDEGRGLPPDASSGRGLANIRSRAGRLRGTCEIVSEPNRGTRIRVTVPFR
jgi:ligand-binding sensor domain-containing protein/signal transduction histidine kinase